MPYSLPAPGSTPGLSGKVIKYVNIHNYYNLQIEELCTHTHTRMHARTHPHTHTKAKPSVATSVVTPTQCRHLCTTQVLGRTSNLQKAVPCLTSEGVHGHLNSQLDLTHIRTHTCTHTHYIHTSVFFSQSSTSIFGIPKSSNKNWSGVKIVKYFFGIIYIKLKTHAVCQFSIKKHITCMITTNNTLLYVTGPVKTGHVGT